MARHRKTRRVHRKGTRKATRRMHQRGGFIQLNPADVNDSSMAISSRLSAAQGQEYASIHAGQHGGQNMVPPDHHRMPNGTIMANSAHKQSGGTADVGYTGMLDSSLRGAARMDPLDQSYNEIVGMRDQTGGRRRRGRKSSHKGRKASRKSRKSRRNMRGGFAPVDAPTMMLEGDQAKESVMAMNPEWKLAENPASFNPSN
uniref:Uncharacterized protein n=1 Tax=viral metagenome TaxID=1070528 RepID=A0A6C0D761_9ZZZZ